MTSDELRALQAPLKARYKDEPATARIVLSAHGDIGPHGPSCTMESIRQPAVAGLHPAAGGDGTFLCSGEMLLEALAGCAGVTLGAVSTALGIALRSAAVHADGDLDFRGTLGVAKDAPVGCADHDVIHAGPGTHSGVRVRRENAEGAISRS